MTDATISELEVIEDEDEPDADSGARSYFLWGFGPLLAAVVLFILMVVLAPSVAPERIVEQPVNTTTLPGTPSS